MPLYKGPLNFTATTHTIGAHSFLSFILTHTRAAHDIEIHKQTCCFGTAAGVNETVTRKPQPPSTLISRKRGLITKVPCVQLEVLNEPSKTSFTD